MKSPLWILLKFLILPTACLIIAGSHVAVADSAADLATSFQQPPPTARPWVYWFWCNGNVTKQGITADLEAMQRVGIGGVVIFDIGLGAPAGPVRYDSPQWHEMIQFATTEAARLGLQVSLNNGGGWAGSGGPWNTPEHSEQQLVSTEVHVTGPAHFDQVLPHPGVVRDFYRDVALLAFPTPEAEQIQMSDFSPKFSVSEPHPSGDPQMLASPDSAGKTALILPRADEHGLHPYVQVQFAKPFTARALSVRMQGDGNRGFEAELQSSDDGVAFKPVRHFAGQLRGLDITFDGVTARYFRLVYTKSDEYMPTTFGVVSFALSPHIRVDDPQAKTLVVRRVLAPQATYSTLPPGLAVDSSRTLDLTSTMDENGHLVWDVPAGNWTLLRFGHTSRGTECNPAHEGEKGMGLECDKMSREAADAHFAGMLGKVIAAAGPLAGKTFVMAHIDSFENGTSNWTHKFREEFKARRGYDLLRYLPAMTGMVVDSPEVTERFLWDFRQTAAELLADNYSGRLEELCREHGIELSIEAYGTLFADNGTYGARADVPMCEFWYKPNGAEHYNGDIEMPSVAHVYGKPIVAAEAFTSSEDEKWLGYPGNIKAQGDWAFAMGINRIVFHRYAMQPWPDIKPGMSMGPFGLHYERTQTWWNQTVPWHQYLARCQAMLQQGLWVADICKLSVERAPNEFDISIGPGMLGDRPGYNYDYATAEALLTRFSVRDGRLVLPDGMTYRVLTLPESQTMTPALLLKIKQLVADGATVIGPKPTKSPSLSNYPACDLEIKALSDELWADCDGHAVKEHAYGKGRIIWGETADEVLHGMNIPPDFTYSDSHGGPALLYAHHTLGDIDFYFVSNKQNQQVAGTSQFRADGRQPEFWWPETGKTEPVAAYTQENGVTSIPMQLDASQSVFVVFRPTSAKTDPIASVALDGKPVIPSALWQPTVTIQKATYGPAGDPDPRHTLDVRDKLQALIDGHPLTAVKVDWMALGGDPALRVTKTLTFDYTVNGGKPHTAANTDFQTITFDTTADEPVERVALLGSNATGNLQLEAWKPGAYEIKTASGQTRKVSVAAIPPPSELTGAWRVTFPFQKTDVSFDDLASWSNSELSDVKYFSGTATYHKTFQVPAEMIGPGHRLYLDLGNVQVIAQAKLNEKDLGILWKSPYRVEITGAAQAGDNTLDIQVTNLWANRMIGDAQLPSDSDRIGIHNFLPAGSLTSWPQWLLDGKPNPTGRQTFTSWELWKKDEPLLPSGLLGPVTLQPTIQVAVP